MSLRRGKNAPLKDAAATQLVVCRPALTRRWRGIVFKTLPLTHRHDVVGTWSRATIVVKPDKMNSTLHAI
jgi:hypothetical protein